MSRIFEGLKRAGNPIANAFSSIDGISVDNPAPARGLESSVRTAPDPQCENPSRHAPAIPQLRVAAPAPEVAPFCRTLKAAPAPVLEAAVREDPRVAEQYRIVRTKIVQHHSQPRLILVSSAGSGDGKTVTSANLAWTLALRAGVPVLLVDADFRRSSLSRLYGIPSEPGLADVLAGDCTPEQAIVRIEQVPGLSVLPCGAVRSNPAELLDSPRWKALAADFSEWFRFTIFDSPPVGAVADYDLVQAACDGILLVMRPDHSALRPSLKAIENTPKEKLLGVVLNHVEDWFLWKSPNSYYYAGPRRPSDP